MHTDVRKTKFHEDSIFRGHLATVGVFFGQLNETDAGRIHKKATVELIATTKCSILCDDTISPSGYGKKIKVKRYMTIRSNSMLF